MVTIVHFSRDNEDVCTNRLGACDANRKGEFPGARRLESQVYACRWRRRQEGIRQPSLTHDSFLGGRDYALGAELFHQAVADEQPDFSVVNCRLRELNRQNGGRICSLDALVFDIDGSIRGMPLGPCERTPSEEPS
jgi:hypothetical protein